MKKDYNWMVNTYPKISGHTSTLKKHMEMSNDAGFYEIRRTGKSTRLINDAIEQLFTTGQTTIIDHYMYGKYKLANKNLFSRFIKRLESEHPGARYSFSWNDDNGCKIKLSDHNDR